MLEEHRHHKVAKDLRDVATLIGEIRSDSVVLGNGEEVVPGLGLVTSGDKLLERIAWLEEGCLRLAVVGSVSCGKSTLVNALLGEERLSVDLEACTGVITQIVHGGNADEVTLVENGQHRIIPETEFRKTIRFTSEEQGSIRDETMFSMPERLAKIDYAVLEGAFPLGEKGVHIVDTLGFRAGRKAEEITKAFLASTDALVFVTRAHPLFEAADQEFLEAQLRLNESRLEHIFFLINDFSRLSIVERAQVKQNAQTRLKDYFLTSEGEFDEELFGRRVFVVNVRDALEVKVNGGKGHALEATGLPALERAIQQMLDDEERLLMVLEGTMTQVLIPILEEARGSIQQGKLLLAKDLSELERTQHEVEERLAALSREADDIRDTFNAFTQRIAERTADHFDVYITHMMDEWEDAWEAMNISVKPVSGLSKQYRESVVAKIAKEFRSYFATQMPVWESEVLEHLEADMAKMATELEEKVQGFVLGLDRVRASMTDQEIPELLYIDQRLLKKATEIFTRGLDSNLIAGKLLGPSIKTIILYTLPIILCIPAMVGLPFLYIALGSIPTGAMFLFCLFMAEISSLSKSQLKRVKNAIGDALRKELSDSMPAMKSDIRTSINQRFKVYAEKFLGALQTEIEQVRGQLESTVAKKRAGDAQVTSEISRLDVITAHLDRLFKQVSHEMGATGGEEISGKVGEKET